MAKQHDQHHARQAGKSAQCDDVGCQRQSAVKKCFGNGGFDVDVLPANHPGQHAGHENIKNRANNQRCQNANGKITLRFLAFLGRRGDSVETDVCEKDVSRARPDSREAHRRKRGPVMAPVREVDVMDAQTDDEENHGHFDRHDRRIKPGTLLNADD